MKSNNYKLLILSIFLLIFFSCDLFIGNPGSDGEAYIAYDWISDTEIIYTDDPAFPNILEIKPEVYEKTVPGTYNFEYTAWDNSTWAGEYTVYVNEGMGGGLFVDGLDGKDVYFELNLTSGGPSFYDWIEPRAVTRKIKTTTDSDFFIETIYKGNFTAVLKYQKMD